MSPCLRLALTVGLAASSALAQPGVLRHLGTLGGPGQELSIPFAIGPGPVVVGSNDYFQSHAGRDRTAFQWTPATGLTSVFIPQAASSSSLNALSADGTIMAGTINLAPGGGGLNPSAFRRVNGEVELLPLPGGLALAQVTGMSGDGRVLVGTANPAQGVRAITWTGTSAGVMLPNLPGSPSAEAYSASQDGHVIVGWSGSGFPNLNMPVRWVNGQVQALGMPAGCSWAWAKGVSADGNTIVGLAWTSDGGSSSRAFKWTPETGMTLLAPASDTPFAEAWSISDDGRLIGGRTGIYSTVWKDGVPHRVQTEMLAAGVTAAPFTGLASNLILSHDGAFIAGCDPVPEAGQELEYHAWLLELPSWLTCRLGSADFNADGDIGTDADIEAFFACLAGNCCPTCGTADFNSDGDIGTDQDIEAFFRMLAGGGC